MNLKRIISTALTVVMLFTAVVAAIPVTASAAYIDTDTANSGATLSLDEIKAYINDDYLKYNFANAQEMLDYELSLGGKNAAGEKLASYIVSAISADGNYAIYINRYTGFMYYKNIKTGQFITSNPTNPLSITSEGTRRELMSQLNINFVESSNSTSGADYNSVQWAALYGQISVSEISGGLRVNYTLGDTSTRFLLPGRITAERYEEYILVPILERFEELFAELCPENSFKFFGNPDYVDYEFGCINSNNRTGFRKYLSDARNVYIKELEKGAQLTSIQNLAANINTLNGAYSLKNPVEYADRQDRLDAMYKDFPITKEGIAIYVCKQDATNAQKRQYSNIIKTYCTDYSMSMMYEDEEECGYVDNSVQKPAFRCAIEYTFNEDGSLSVRLPANSITFDEEMYTLRSVTPLKYFAAGNMNKDGYIFFPDGSGTVVEYGDFYDVANNKKIPLSINASVFGSDYCYSKITGAHREQITMPVYGMVYTQNATPATADITGTTEVKNGYFAILEEGAPLANLGFQSGGSAHPYASVYASYNPYPSDEYDLSETISVGSLGTYSIVAESKYSGSYVTRVVMLTNDAVGKQVYGEGKYYSPSYSGMASYYRNYLKANGTLADVALASGNIPLYLEVLGSMTIKDKFLSFPIEKSIPLTSFDDIVTMYEQLSDSDKYVESLIAKYEKELADELAKPENEIEETVVINCQTMIENYKALLGNIEDIKNINFRLTGFTNGGMYFTYPTKIKWERACGGKSGFKKLLKTSAEISSQAGYNFSVYPEFDFMYINNTASFDGISNKNTVSKMVDNRYASKQVYNSVLQEYESFFEMLISSDVLDDLYTKFHKKYSKYDISKISVSTLGSDLNSNFDEENSINRDEAREDVVALLERMAKTDGYDIMTEVGNIYTVKYASHILNATVDSSHFRYSSYTVPFLGMILHGHVNYTGSPLNYSGSLDYDILRYIENGAAPYYILCYDNSSYMKEDEQLSKYYGVDYNNWYVGIVETYHTLNTAIGDLQNYTIVAHSAVIAERILEDEEKATNLVNLQNELLELFEEQLASAVADAYAELKADAAANVGKKVRVVVDKETLALQFAEILGVSVANIESSAFYTEFAAIADAFEAEYPGSDTEGMNKDVVFGAINYESKYNYYTDSTAFDEDYKYTDYTLDNGKVVIVTYQNGDSIVRFILNYNIYSVRVRLENGKTYDLDKYEFIRL